MSGKRAEFHAELERVRDIADDDVRLAILAFADALDPDDHHVALPQANANGTVSHDSTTYATAEIFCKVVRLAHARGLDVLAADADTVNRFMSDLVTEPEQRRYDLVAHDKALSRSSARTWQTALRAFYRFCTEPGTTDDRPDVTVDWPAEDIRRFTRDRAAARHDKEDRPDGDDLDALRTAIVEHSQNTHRDLAFLELAAGTAQRVYALVTLKVTHVHVDPAALGADDVPHIMLNPAIENNGDKGAIQQTGRYKPIVTDPEPVRRLLETHPLRDPDIRARHGVEADFEDCYLFIGSLNATHTDPSTHWHQAGPTKMLDRRKAATARMSSVDTVEVPVNPHNWRHYVYTKSQDLAIDESIRRKVFGWAPGSDTGQRTYGHKANEDAAKQFAAAWADEFGQEEETVDLATSVLANATAAELPPDTLRDLAQHLATNESFADMVARLLAETE